MFISASATPPRFFQSTTGGVLYNVTNPSSSTYPIYAYYEYTWTATNSSATLSFSFRNDPGGWMLDDVQVYHASSQLIQNPGFETGNLTGWLWSGSCFFRNGDIYSGSSNANSGQYYYYDPCSSYGDTISQTFSTVSGDLYNISFWLTNYKCCSSTQIANITLT